MSRPSPDTIIAAVCHEWGILVRDSLFEQAIRSSSEADARNVAAYLMVRVFGYPVCDASDALGRQDGSTYSAAKRCALRMKTDALFQTRVERARLRAKTRRVITTTPRVSVAAPVTCSHAPEIQRLHKMGWSMKGLCKRFDMSEAALAPIIGVQLGEALWT